MESTVLMDEQSGEEVPRRERKRMGLLVASAALVGVVIGVTYSSGVANRIVNLSGFQRKDAIPIVPSAASCSKPGDNCGWSGCCLVSGHQCWEKFDGTGFCNETCVASQNTNCGIVANGKPSMDQIQKPDLTFYCYAVCTANTGSPEPSTELELLKLQKKFGANIFGCQAWDVFADEETKIDDETNAIVVKDEYNEFHRIKRKETGTWVNWALFFQVWKQVRTVGKWQNYGYTVKADADAVFIPGRLYNWLSNKAETEHGIYYENCKNVQYGFFGNLEVLSQKATAVLTANLEDCHDAFGPCADDGCDWKWGPWGEDVFAQRCMDRHHVEKVEGFDMTTDGACESDRPLDQRKNKKWHAEDCSKVLSVSIHPFKQPKDYFKCLGEVMQTTYDISSD